MSLCTLGDLWPQGITGTPKDPPPGAAGVVEAEAPPVLCAYSGKVPYGRKKDAMAHMRSLACKNPDCLLNVYVCKWCYSWHVGRL